MKTIDLRDIDKDRECPIEQFCRGLEYAGETHKHGYFHYTNWSNFAKMARQVRVSDSSKPHHVIVTKAPWDKNDLSEGKLDRRFWYVSFTYMPHEVVPMWFMYGKGKSDAVRLQFSVASIRKWASQDASRVCVYQIPKNKSDGTYKRIVIPVKNVRLFDIGYYAKYSKRLQKREGVIHRNTKYSVAIPSGGIGGLKGDDKRFAAYLKESTWAEEREVRLLLEFEKPIEFDMIAIEFDKPIKELVKNLRNRVISSPWLNTETVNSLTIFDCAKSECNGKVG